MSSDVATQEVIYDGIQSFAELKALISDNSAEVVTVDPFTKVEKDELIGVPFMILSYRFFDGDYEGGAVAVRCMLEDDTRVVFVDGSTGIREQLRGFSDKGIHSLIWVAHGLRKSDYTYRNEKTGKDEPAKTYYLS